MVLFKIRSASAGGSGMTIGLKVMAAIIPILLAAGAPSTKAVPLFCSDVVHYADRLLTGCAPDTDPALRGVDVYLPRETSRGASHEVDALLSRTRPNPLVQVGPNGLTDEPSGGKEVDTLRHDGKALKGTYAPADKNPPDSHKSTFTKDETWYYMDFDRDGTYLFFGDPDRLDPLDRLDNWATFETPDDGLPKGIGIGKRWRF